MYYIIITCMELKISHGLILLGGGGKRPQASPPHQYASGQYTNGSPGEARWTYGRAPSEFLSMVNTLLKGKFSSGTKF